jgi:hypothetical protein
VTTCAVVIFAIGIRSAGKNQAAAFIVGAASGDAPGEAHSQA